MSFDLGYYQLRDLDLSLQILVLVGISEHIDGYITCTTKKKAKQFKIMNKIPKLPVGYKRVIKCNYQSLFFFETYHVSIQYAVTRINRLHKSEGRKTSFFSSTSSDPSDCPITGFLIITFSKKICSSLFKSNFREM